MKNSMVVGMAIGMIAGACIASNSRKTRETVTDVQEQIKNKLNSHKNSGEGCDCNCGQQ